MPSMSTNTDAELAKPLIDPESQEQCSGACKNTQTGFDPDRHRSTATSVLLASATTGFVVQLVSLSSYAYLLTRWGSVIPTAVTTSGDATERNLFLAIQCLSQIDLCLYCVVWVGFAFSLTTRGVQFVVSSITRGDQPRVDPSMRRFVFSLGVHCLVGLVLGAFVSWTLIDMVMGFAVPYSRIIETIAIDLGLCYCMMLCYDCGGGVEDDDDDDDDDDDGDYE